MAISKSISIRVPQEMLEQLDTLAAQKYQVRKKGASPNRSQVILECLQRGLDNYQAQCHTAAASISNDNVVQNGITLSGGDITRLIEMQMVMQQQMQQLLAQALLPAGTNGNSQMSDLVAAIKSTKEEVADIRQEVEKVLDGREPHYQPSQEDDYLSGGISQKETPDDLQSDCALAQVKPNTEPSDVVVVQGKEAPDLHSDLQSSRLLAQTELSDVAVQEPEKSYIPSDEEILQKIRDLDRELNTDNYLPIFHLREALPLSREELDRALYRLERNDLIELSALQEVIAYTPEQINAGIPQNIGGRLFFIIVE